MKKLVLSMIYISLAGPVAEAGTKVFTGESRYTKNQWNAVFSSLEQQGVIHAAETEALARCNEFGAINCTILPRARITMCNSGGSDLGVVHCAARAQARGEIQ